jgi:hypothetical protein
LRARVSNFGGPLEAGQVIFLKANEVTLSERQAKRDKLRGANQQIDYDGASLVQQSDILKDVYHPEDSSFLITREKELIKPLGGLLAKFCWGHTFLSISRR